MGQLHTELIEAFHALPDKNALAWAALDGKSEQHYLRALATTINRRRGKRIALTEFKRNDLALLHDAPSACSNRHLQVSETHIAFRYEAKAGQLFDFAACNQVKDDKTYLGWHLNDDIEKKQLRCGEGAALFFLSDADEPSHHLKYFRGHRASLDDATNVLATTISSGRLAYRETIDCGIAGGTQVSLHLFIFDPIP